MSYDLYDLMVPRLIHIYKVLEHILKKAEDHAAEHKIPLEDLASARLAPDMYPLRNQINILDCISRILIDKIAVQPAEVAEADWTRQLKWEDFSPVITKTRDALSKLTREQFRDKETTKVKFAVPSKSIEMTGKEAIEKFVRPNCEFHLTITYAILRHKGVPIGKIDFLLPEA